MKIIYRLEEVKCFCYDRYDEEYVEKAAKAVKKLAARIEEIRNGAK